MLVVPVNDAPVATDETRTMSEDGGPLSIDFGALVSDGETSDADLSYDITNPDPAKGSLGGEGPTRTFTPAANFNGTVNIDYTPADRGDPDNCSAANLPCATARISAQKIVSVTVDAVNDTPSFTKGPDQTKDEDIGAQTVDDWATAFSAGSNESGQTVDFEVTNDNNGLFAAGGQPSVAPNGTLTYTPAVDKNGSAAVTIKARDSGTENAWQDISAEQTFTINVTAVNDAPIVSNLQGDGDANDRGMIAKEWGMGTLGARRRRQHLEQEIRERVEQDEPPRTPLSRRYMFTASEGTENPPWCGSGGQRSYSTHQVTSPTPAYVRPI